MKKALIFLFAAFCCAAPVISAEKTELPVMYEKFKDQTPQELWMLGRMYYNGERSALIPVDQHQAYLWWKIAAEKGHSDAMNDLAGCYIQGTGVEKNAAEGLKWLKKAVELKNLRACSNLGLHYMEGDIVKRDPVEAARLWKIAADGGHPRALYNLGWCYAEGVGVEQNSAQAFKLWLQAAEKGEPYAMLNCARCYRDGKETERNMKEAIKWYRKSAEMGMPRAMFELAQVLLAEKENVNENKEEAIKWLTIAADEAEMPEAQVLLGMCLVVPGSDLALPADTIRLFTAAADKGHPVAQYLLGVALYEGAGIKQDREKGLDLIRKAAAQGLPEAQAYLEKLKAGQK